MNKHTALNSLVIEGIGSNYVDGTFTLTYHGEHTEDFSITAVIFPQSLKECLSAKFEQSSEITLRIVGGLMCDAGCVQLAVDHVALLNFEKNIA